MSFVGEGVGEGVGELRSSFFAHCLEAFFLAGAMFVTERLRSALTGSEGDAGITWAGGSCEAAQPMAPAHFSVASCLPSTLSPPSLSATCVVTKLGKSSPRYSSAQYYSTYCSARVIKTEASV